MSEWAGQMRLTWGGGGGGGGGCACAIVKACVDWEGKLLVLWIVVTMGALRINLAAQILAFQQY